jgi:hypothetical protein
MVLIFLAHVERRHIAATFIVINWHVGWVDGEGVVEIEILGPFTKVLELPHARDGNLLKAPSQGGRQFGRCALVEVIGASEGVLGEVEQPFAREKLALGTRHMAREGIVWILV